MNPSRARVLHGKQGSVQNLSLQGQVPALRVRGGKILLHIAQARVVKALGAGPSKWSQVTGFERLRGRREIGVELCRRILDHVKRDVAKVPLIGDAVSAPQA